MSDRPDPIRATAPFGPLWLLAVVGACVVLWTLLLAVAWTVYRMVT
jgi:hypothetical protein